MYLWYLNTFSLNKKKKLSNIGLEASEEKSFEIIAIFSKQMYWAHTDAYASKLDLAVKRSNIDVRPSF